MTSWHELTEYGGPLPEWPYPIRYDREQEIETDVLVIGGGIAGCWAAISAARKMDLKVTLVEKAATIRSGAGGPGGDHWDNPMTSPLSNVDPEEWCQGGGRYRDQQPNRGVHDLPCQSGGALHGRDRIDLDFQHGTGCRNYMPWIRIS